MNVTWWFCSKPTAFHCSPFNLPFELPLFAIKHSLQMNLFQSNLAMNFCLPNTFFNRREIIMLIGLLWSVILKINHSNKILVKQKKGI